MSSPEFKRTMQHIGVEDRDYFGGSRTKVSSKVLLGAVKAADKKIREILKGGISKGQ